MEQQAPPDNETLSSLLAPGNSFGSSLIARRLASPSHGTIALGDCMVARSERHPTDLKGRHNG